MEQTLCCTYCKKIEGLFVGVFVGCCFFGVFFQFTYENYSRNIFILCNFSKKSRYEKKLAFKMLMPNNDCV